VHVGLLLHPLADQFTKANPGLADAASTTFVPMPKLPLQLPVGQLIGGVGGLVLVTLPGLEFRGPAIVTPNVGSIKVAVIVGFGLVAAIVTVH
jgi:hypothetical protein